MMALTSQKNTSPVLASPSLDFMDRVPAWLLSLGPDVWVGAQSLPPASQGLTILGTPLGSPAFSLSPETLPQA